jgi:hypothetical protein
MSVPDYLVTFRGSNDLAQVIYISSMLDRSQSTVGSTIHTPGLENNGKRYQEDGETDERKHTGSHASER